MDAARPTHADRFHTSGATGTANTLAGRAFVFGSFAPDAGDNASTTVSRSQRRRRPPSHPPASGDGHPN